MVSNFKGTMTGHFAITGEGLCIGDDLYIDGETHLAAAMARD